MFAAALRADDVFTRFTALSAIRRLGPLARSLVPAIREAKLGATEHKDITDYSGRMVDYLPEQLTHAN